MVAILSTILARLLSQVEWVGGISIEDRQAPVVRSVPGEIVNTEVVLCAWVCMCALAE